MHTFNSSVWISLVQGQPGLYSLVFRLTKETNKKGIPILLAKEFDHRERIKFLWIIDIRSQTFRLPFTLLDSWLLVFTTAEDPEHEGRALRVDFEFPLEHLCSGNSCFLICHSKNKMPPLHRLVFFVAWECMLAQLQEALALIPSTLGMVARACSPRVQEVEAGRWEVQGHPSYTGGGGQLGIHETLNQK